MKQRVIGLRNLTRRLSGYSMPEMMDGDELIVAISGDDRRKGTEKFAQCDPSLDARIVPEVHQDLAHLPDQCFELEEVAIHSAITNSGEVHR
jgi:hypothetical protein